MFRIYDEKNYDWPAQTQAFLQCQTEINRHSATLVLSVLIKLYDMLIPHLDKILDYLSKRQYTKITGTVIKKAYVYCARTYIGDYVLYTSMSTPESDIFY